MSLMGMLNSNKKALSQLHNIDAEQILAAFNAQIGIMVPSELRRITIEIITSLIVDHINPKLDAVDRFELGAYIDSQIISLKDWSRWFLGSSKSNLPSPLRHSFAKLH